MGTLFIVATPIGNLQDITFRAVKVLSEADAIVSEDTRRTGMLLKNLGIKKSPLLISYYEQNEVQRIPEIINALKNDLNVCLVSDAGTPLISDPGFKLVRECQARNIKVISVPGPSAAISALVSSGLPTDKFTFIGFPPKKPGHRLDMFKKLKDSNDLIQPTVIFYESPHKILKTLTDLKEVFGDIEIVIARELTKLHEEIVRTNIGKFIEDYSKKAPKGELTILFSLK